MTTKQPEKCREGGSGIFLSLANFAKHPCNVRIAVDAPKRFVKFAVG